MYDVFPLQLLEFHQSMLFDQVRMKKYLQAILKTVQPGEVVLDIGCGTGIMSFFACMAGARRVYAVEQEPIIHMAQALADHNGYGGRIRFINDLSVNINLPEPIDVIITETIGNLGFEEGILGWVLDARRNFLAPQGRILPQTLAMVLAPVEAPDAYQKLDRWRPDFYGLDFSPLKRLAMNNLYWTEFSADSYLGQPQELFKVDLLTFNKEEFSCRGNFLIRRPGILHGLGCWFRATLAPSVKITNAPPLKTPSWNHRLLPLAEPLDLQAEDHLEVSLQVTENASGWQWEVIQTRAGQRLAQQSQSTAAGELRHPDPPETLQSRCVRLNTDGRVDFFILGLMDGETSLREMARKTATEFPDRFRHPQDALSYIQNRIAEYGYYVAGKNLYN